MSALSSFHPDELAALERLSAETGHAAEDLACEFAASYYRLVVDAPKALPGKPLLAIVRRLDRRKNG